ncbi:hypothetical protein GCM10022248_55260 [Nonomuraea soli]
MTLGTATLTSVPPASATSGTSLARFSNWATQECITTNPDHHLFSRYCYVAGDYKYAYQQWYLQPSMWAGAWQLSNRKTGRCLELVDGDNGQDNVVTAPCEPGNPLQLWIVENQSIVSAVHKAILYDHGATTDIRATWGGSVNPPAYGRWSQIS